MNLGQTQTWTTKDGTTLLLTQMSLRHKRNVVAMLERYAASIELTVSCREMALLNQPVPTVLGSHGRDIPGPPVSLWPGGEMAEEALLAEFDARQADPVAWLHTLPLVKELDRQIAAAQEQA